jgi:ADP-heptose:LPS heptosyltransferase
VLIGGSQQDIDLAQQTRQMAKSSPIIMAGRITIEQFAAIAKKSALFVGSDTGAMHVATAIGTPVVALFGPSNPAEWGPRGGPTDAGRASIQPACAARRIA